MGIWDRFRRWVGRPFRGPVNSIASAAASLTDPGAGGAVLVTLSADGPVPLEKASGQSHTRRLRVDEQRDGVRTPWVPVQPRWLPEEVEEAWCEAEQGTMRPIASLIEAMRGDGTIGGLSRTRCSMARLPVNFTGDPYLCQELRGVDPEYADDGVLLTKGIVGAFDIMCPIPALIDLIFTGIMAGVAVAELVDDPVTGIPVLTPRDLHFLRYDWGTRQWLYYGGKDTYVVTPGAGRWVLFMPESETRPWKSGAWLPCSLAFVTKLSAVYDRMRWQAQLADPLKVFETTNSVSDTMRMKLEEFLTNFWMRAPGIVLPEGVKAGMVESTGRGYDVYEAAEKWAEGQIAKALAGGQDTTSEGGMGFGNGDIFAEIAENIIEGTASALGRCISKEVIGPWARRKYPHRLAVNGNVPPKVGWDVRSPARRLQEAEVLTKVAAGIKAADEVLAPRGQCVDVPTYLQDIGVRLPTMTLAAASAPPPQLPAAPGSAPLQLGMGDDAGPSEAEPSTAAALAEKMTLHGVERCRHGCSNRCPKCGIKRVEDFEPGVDGGEPVWGIAWAPIDCPDAPPALPAAQASLGLPPAPAIAGRARRVVNAFASAKRSRSWSSSTAYEGDTVALTPALMNHPALTRPITEPYMPADVGGWIGCIFDAAETWIAFVDVNGRTLLWTRRDADGGVVGLPYLFQRPDLAQASPGTANEKAT